MAPKEVKELTWEEISKHNTEDDCWIVIHGKVYDVKDFLDEHPGGPDIITELAGQDCTTDFEDTGHSDDARRDLENYLIGTVKEIPGQKPKAKSAAASDNSGSGMSLPIFLGIFFAVVAVAFVYIRGEEGNEE